MINENLANTYNKPSKTILRLFYALIAFIIIWYISTPLITFVYYIKKGAPLLEYSILDLVKTIILLTIIVVTSIALLVLNSKGKLERILKVFLMITSVSAILLSISVLFQTDIVSNLITKWPVENLWFINFFFFLHILSFIAFWVGTIGSIVIFVRSKISWFLLETSAFKSFSDNELEKYSLNGLKIMISPYTFWELLCHLDEENWEKNKKIACKCSRVKILDDPRAIIEKNLKYKVERLIDSLPDNYLISDAIKCLNKSNSINDFYNSDFIDIKGERHLVKGCSEMVQKTLDEEAEKYSHFVNQIYNYFIQRKYDLNSDHDCHTVIMSLVKSAEICAIKNSSQVRNLDNYVIDKYYLYFAYIFERTKHLFLNGTKYPPRNDYEDSIICLHLSLSEPIEFVTSDKKLSEALINSLNRLKRIGYSSNKHPRIFYEENKPDPLKIENG